MLNCNHIALHNFYSKYHNLPEIKKIFHYFVKSKFIVFIGENKCFSNNEIDNKDLFLKLTLDELDNILKK